MNNPYQVLGVPEGSSPEQVKAAYKALAAKYQSAGYENGPLADIAQKKMDEINAAYDAIIMSSDSGNYCGEYKVNGGGSYYSAYSAGDLADIRSKIIEGRLDDAELLLDGIPEAGRTAEWFYLKGTVQQKRGWLEEAAKNFEKAVRADPSDASYRAAYENVRQASTGGYKTARRGKKDDGCSFCDICSGLLCADCCCECTGGDLIPCC